MAQIMSYINSLRGLTNNDFTQRETKNNPLATGSPVLPFIILQGHRNHFKL